MQGGYDTWFYEDIAGIPPDASGPGFKVIHFEPTMTSYLSWAKASIETPYGRTAKRMSLLEEKIVWGMDNNITS